MLINERFGGHYIRQQLGEQGGAPLGTGQPPATGKEFLTCPAGALNSFSTFSELH